MTTYLGESCSFGLPRVPFVNCRRFMYLVISLLVRMWDLIVSVPDHCLSFYFDDFCVYSVFNTVLLCLVLSIMSKLYQKTVICFENGFCACYVAFSVCGL